MVWADDWYRSHPSPKKIGLAAVWLALELSSYVDEEISQPNVSRFEIMPFMPKQSFLNRRNGYWRSEYLDRKGSLEHPGKTALYRGDHRSAWQYKGQRRKSAVRKGDPDRQAVFLYCCIFHGAGPETEIS